MKTYIVQPGDTLGTIAQKFMGTSLKWRELWELNADTIPNPDIVHVGQRIKIPETSLISPVKSYTQPKTTAVRPAYEPINIDNNYMEKIKNIFKNKTVMYASIGITGLLVILLFIKRK